MAEFIEMMLHEGKVEEDTQTLKDLGETHNAYEAVLTKRAGMSSFGFGYRCIHPNTGLIVTALANANSALNEWNETCDLVDTICVGDRIINVNGKDTAKEMVQELRSCVEVKMKILKAGPRWHLDGATAECMKKIEWAMSKGLRFETRAIEETIGQNPAVTGDAPFCFHNVLLFLGAMIPSLMLMVCFSDMFYGLRVQGTLSDTKFNLVGNFMASCSGMYALCLYVVDWSAWTKPMQKYLAAAVVIYGFCFAFILKCRFYPYAPIIICLFHIVFFLGLLRASFVRNMSRSHFYKSAWRCAFFAAVVVLSMWMIWIFDENWDGSNMYNEETKSKLASASESIYKNTKVSINGQQRSLDYAWDCHEKNKRPFDFRLENNVRISTGYRLTEDEANERDQECAKIKTIWFLAWISPFIAFMSLLIISIFCFFNTWDYSRDSAGGIERLIKGAIIGVCGVLIMVWVSVAVAAASMALTTTLVAFCASAMMALMIWCYLEIGKRAITSSIKESKIMRMLIMLATSNLVRAGIVVVFGVLIPFGFLLAYLNQKVRKLRGKATSDSMFTDGAERVMRSLQYWNWGNIMLKVDFLVWIYWTFFVGAQKWTYVFLSWLNSVLLELDLAVVIAIFFVVGFTMFMLPPVPGIPVYIASGVVIAARASATSVGFAGGIIIACFVSFLLKLAACSGQYAIGFCLGQSVKIQQLVGVDKILMRSVERILLKRGFSRSKVSVLVGGPDWPTSVICGILKLNLRQMLLGTCPVFFVSSPCVVAGAFLAGPADTGTPSEDNEGLYDTLSSSLLAVSLLIQAATMAVAAYYIQDIIGKHSEELAKPRPEHAPVMELTAKEAEQVAAWNDVLQWPMLTTLERVILLSAVSTSLLSMFFFVFFGDMVYRQFQVSGDIHASFGKGGLEGNALNIVKPLGYVANGLFFLGILIHLLFVFVKTRKAKKHLQWKRSHPSQAKKASLAKTDRPKSSSQNTLPNQA